MILQRILTEGQLALSALDLETWPDAERELLAPEVRERYDRLKGAVQLIVGERASIAAGARTAKVSHDEMERVLRRCFDMAPDGRIQGFRALVKYRRHKKYARSGKRKGGYAGQLEYLFAKFPDVEHDVIQRHKRGESVRHIRKFMLEALRTLGLGAADYPFNTASKGREALRRYFNRLGDELFTEVAHARYGKAAGQRSEQREAGSKRVVLRPYERVEFDAHRCDAKFIISIDGPDGLPRKLALERIWLLTAIDCGTRAVLGYGISLNRQCTLEDVLGALDRSVKGPPRPQITIAGLTYNPGAGFPQQLIPVCAYHLYDRLSLDNALAHQSAQIHASVSQKMQCVVNLGTSGHPNERAFVERFFGTLTAHGMQRTPSSTGTGPDDPRRKDPDEQACRYEFTLDEGLQLLDVLIANYNAEVHGETHFSPLDYLRTYFREVSALHRTVPPSERDTWTLNRLWVRAVIQGGIKRGRRPYIKYLRAEYRNQAITGNTQLVGREVWMCINPDDLRLAEVFLDGTSLGWVRAGGRWGLVKHSLATRKLFNKLVKEKEIHLGTEDPIESVRRHLKRKATASKKAANQLAKLNRELDVTDEPLRHEERPAQGRGYQGGHFEPDADDRIQLPRRSVD